MDIDQPSEIPQPCTILRVKRKRTDEPLDALVFESKVRRKKSKGGLDVFQFAETVEGDAWDDAKRTKDLHERIAAAAREQAKKAEISLPEAAAPTSAPSAPLALPRQQSNQRYTIVPKEEDEVKKPRYPTAPPKVISAKDLRKPSVNVTMYDAVPSVPEPSAAEAMDTEMEKFLPMLQDYLRVNDITIPTTPPVGSTSQSQEDEYVWDIFYHRPASLSEWNQIANFGTLTGLPPSLNDPYASDTDSEPEDEDDEDSNAEDYYKNDYPEEEDAVSESDGSDEFHEDSDYEELRAEDQPNGSDDEWSRWR
ncbi:hypothetical protein JAAARDRAFT_170388 [Jaapia argillacea MUCL 33604]|uniref:Probable RNA polymerase II nuclear localization protein SLC7A6OS n=1 Tax=Jaapia argillacea MUCL 33604 TaxID=933084 RepID=A0A067Q547_9AGAM|nr:hypothetical protein JAAARDRAFT_170388 [Jaapia argillacea MUCL 33604]